MKQFTYGESARAKAPHKLSPIVEACIAALVAAVLLAPSFWQPRLLAGDLQSHVYNAWLATQVEQGRVAGLTLSHPLTNVLGDWALQRLVNLGGPAAAEQIVAGLAVEIFFWGAFALAAVVAGQRCWVIAPSLGMLAYGLVFQMGFLNFYLSTGLSVWLLVILWQPRGRGVWLAAPVALLALLAHIVPLLWAIASLAYVHLLRRLPGRSRVYLFAAGCGVLVLGQAVLLRVFPARWSLGDVLDLEGALGVAGAEQLWLFGLKYLIPAGGILIIWFLLLLDRLDRAEFLKDPAVHLWCLAMVALILLPSGIQLPQYAFPLNYVPQRMSLLVALLFCTMVARGPSGRSLTRASSLLAAAFFTMLYMDAQAFNGVEEEIARLVRELPPGERVVAAIEDSGSPRLNALTHVVSAACAGHCYDFGNYEPATGQFRLRASGENGVVAWDMGIVKEIESGAYVVGARQAPVYSVCATTEPGRRFTLRKLSAGEKMCKLAIPVSPQF